MFLRVVLTSGLGLQVPGADKGCYSRQRLHEELGDDADPRDRGLHVPRGVRGRQPHHQGG